MKPPLSILLVATKSPWPPVDGGRLLVLKTLELLRDAGARVTLVAPCPRGDLEAATSALTGVCRPELVPGGRSAPVSAQLGGLLRGLPAALARHRRPTVARRVADLLDTEAFSLVHAEQIQALPQSGAARVRRVPLVIRAQNVESILWRGLADLSRPVLAPLLRWEAWRLERWEGRALERAALAVALTAEDRRRLAQLAPAARVEEVPVPFPAELPAGAPLPGSPAVLLLGSGGWRPNRAGAERFLRQTWPRVRERLPEAKLHLFTPASIPSVVGVEHHPPPADSRAAFGAGGILVVPLDVASGVRMKILEAWARGIPVVATRAAAMGLGARHGEELLEVSGDEELAEAVAALHGDPELRQRLVAGGRERLVLRHDPDAVAARYLELYGEVAAGRPE